MKKTLIAIAALAATGAFAQSSVTISGQMDAGYAHTTGQNGITARGVDTGVHGASRLRFVGVDDLGGGMKANFWLEMQPSFKDGTTSAAGLFNRGAWAGLSGSFGEVRLGRQGTNSMTVICTADVAGCYSGFYGGGLLFSGNGAPGTTGAAWFAANPTRGLNAAGATVTGMSQASSTGNTNQTDATKAAQDSTRYVKAIRYTLPELSKGLALNVTNAYGSQNTTDGAAGGGSVGLDAKYDAGPLSAAFAYQKAYAEATANSASGTLTSIGGSYDLGVAKVGLALQRESAQGSGNTVTLYDSAKAFGLTVHVPMGAWTPYAKMGNRSYTAGGNSVTTAQVGNLGARYALSKKTNFYADYVRNNASLAGVGAFAATAAVANPKQLSFGIQTTF